MCADIIIMKPHEDVCTKCSDLQSQISGALNEEACIDTTDALTCHVEKATEA